MWKGAAYGPLEHVTVAFDAAVDPGPPTADVFARAAAVPAASMLPAPATALPTIGTVIVQADYDYRVVRAGRYWIPQWYKASYWIAYWDVFGRPAAQPRYFRGIPDTWWYDTGKTAKTVDLRTAPPARARPSL